MRLTQQINKQIDNFYKQVGETNSQYNNKHSNRKSVLSIKHTQCHDFPVPLSFHSTIAGS